MDSGIADYVSKLSPKKGDLIVFQMKDQHNLEALAQATGVLHQMGECAKAGMFDPEIPCIVIYGKDSLEAMGATKVGYIHAKEAPGGIKQLSFSQVSYENMATLVSELYLTKDGHVLAVPVRTVGEAKG